jgi:alkylation response protein AidB-like acyl-CoA dehydrogenase
VKDTPLMSASPLLSDEVLATLAAHAGAADAEPVWPAASWETVRSAGVLGWCIPTEYGGLGLGGTELLEGYERLASACLTSCFILSQRDAACRRIRDHGGEALRRELLRPLACGGRFATVGLSHLTTSRQHGQPAMRVQMRDGDFVLDGIMPWVTGAEQADFFITGAVLDDGRQILTVLPRDCKGITIGPPLDLMALTGSLTTEVRCEQVTVAARWLLAGPVEKVMTVGRGGTGGLETSCLALGLAGAAVAYLQTEASRRPDLRASADRLEQARQNACKEMYRLAHEGGTPEAALALRARVNTLVLRATQAALTASKGTGFLRSHPAQRWARQAMFFLVWSCPRPAAEATLAYLTGPEEPVCP